MSSLFHSAKAVIFSAAVLVAAAVASRGAKAQEEFEGWNLEPSVRQAHLVMVARVASIGRVTMVEGAKTDIPLREFRFEPIRRLKGIFQRSELSMTAADLGIYANDAATAPPLKEGEFRLLILVQQQGLPSYGCVSAAPGVTTFDERVPLLTGPDDPLVAVIETLIRVADSRSRRERATLLVDQLANADGLAAVPLLSSLLLRADWAAADERAHASIARLARESNTAVRIGALKVLRNMLASGTLPNDPQQLDSVADALREILESHEANTRVRVAGLETLASLLALKRDSQWPRELLVKQLTTAATYAERSAAVTALARIAHPDAVTAVLDALAALPLDEKPERESIFTNAAIRVDTAGAERLLLNRLNRSIAARQSLQGEIIPLGQMRSRESLPLLLAAAEQVNLAQHDRHYLAWALGQLGDDRAVPLLARWMRGNTAKQAALAALEHIGSQAAAREARPLLKTESFLPFKLRLARLLARHGIADGYPLATEHLADAGRTAEAALVLAALDDPRTVRDLSAILDDRPDRRWHAAALAGLATIGNAAAEKQLLEILADERNALTADAAEAAGLAVDDRLLLPLAKLVQSRNKPIAMASLVALRRFLIGVRISPQGLAAADNTGEWADTAIRFDFDVKLPRQENEARTVADVPAATRAAIADSVAWLVVDTYVEADLRQQAFAVARLLRGDQYPELLANLADQAELEGTSLLTEVQAERRRLRGLGEQL